MKSIRKLCSKGFTLIELLVVMAVIGVLAAIILVALNPNEQFARSRDAQRKSNLGQLARALQAYATSNNATYPAVAAAPAGVGAGTPTPPAAAGTWMGTLVAAGEIKSLVPDAGTTCTLNPERNYCYGTGTIAGNSEAIVYVKLESLAEKSKCTTTGQLPYFLWSSVDNKTGLVCSAIDPVMPTGVNAFTFK